MAWNDKKAGIKWQEKLDTYKVQKYKTPKPTSIRNSAIDEYERMERYANLFREQVREQEEKKQREEQRIRDQREFEAKQRELIRERKLMAAREAKQRKIDEAERQLANSDMQDLGIF